MAEWNESLLAHPWNLRRAVELAIIIEDMGMEFYQGLAMKWQSDEDLRALFSQLAKEQVAHGDGLRAILSGLGVGASDAPDARDKEHPPRETEPRRASRVNRRQNRSWTGP